MKPTLIFLFAAVSITGCASSMPMSGGTIDDHEVTVSRCGVGNYIFLYLKDSCTATKNPAR